MIAELVIDTAQPGNAGKIMSLVETVRVARLTGPERLLGAWTSEIGQVNQVTQLWSYADEAEWARATAERAASAAFVEDYAAPVEAMSVGQERRLLRAARPFRTDLEPGHFYELRVYSLVPGGPRRFVEAMLEILPFRESFSPNVGVFTPITGDLNQLVHMWAYRDLQHRSEVRGGLAKRAEWQAYLKVIFPLIREMQCTMLLPAAFSPVR